MIRIGIVGGTGYTGVERLRLLAQHLQAEIVHYLAKRCRYGGFRNVSELARARRPQVRVSGKGKSLGLRCGLLRDAERNRHGTGACAARGRCKGYRSGSGFPDQGHRRVGKMDWHDPCCPGWVDKAAYGLPEMNCEQIRSARLGANPGCYPTAVQLGFMPLLKSGLLETSSLIVDAKSGVSGASRKAETPIMFAEASDNFKAYGVSGHRHLPEIRQGLSMMSGAGVGLTFVPHLTPIIRGIHATLYGRIKSAADFQGLFERAYADEPFVDVLPEKSHPETRSVRSANICRIAIHRPQGGDTLVILSVIDNLVKGTAGQAVQNMNLMFGLDESTGLCQLPLLP